MKKSWLSGLEDDAKKQMEGYYKGSPMLRARLILLIKNKMETRNSASESLNCYESPSWAFIQADKNGYNRGLQEVLELISN